MMDITERKLHEIELRRARDEANDALERQTATADILRVISGSPADVQPTFKAILESTTRVCESSIAALFLFDGEVLTCAAHHNTTPAFAKVLDQMRTPPSGETPTRLAALKRKVVHAHDYLNDKRFSPLPGQLREHARTVLSVPLLREGALVGVITTWRREVKAFSDRHIALLQTFADQAVIAIENVRLFNETRKALERQTATAEILRAISTSPTDTQPVFEAILGRAAKLCGADNGILFRYADGAFHTLAKRIPDPAFAELFREPRRPAPGSKSGLGQLMRQLRTVHIPDLLKDAATLEQDPLRVQTVKGGMRSWLGVPLLKEGGLIGAIVTYHSEARPFSEAQIALLETFADQAVIAIENVRLFNETKEALERQTATTEILRVIASSPADVQPVFDAISSSAQQLFGGMYVAVVLVQRGQIEEGSSRGDPGVVEKLHEVFPIPLSRESVTGRTIVDREVQNFADMNDPALPEYARSLARSVGVGALLGAPMLREGSAIGAIMLFRKQPGEFGAKQVALLKTFADQAVIAIENVRLFNETKESLERQTATAEILKAIASSPSDVRPVFDAIVRNAGRVCESVDATLVLRQGEELEATANWGPIGFNPGKRRPLNRETVMGRAIIDGEPVHVEDITTAPGFDMTRKIMAETGFEARSALAVPLLQGNRAMGSVLIRRTEAGPFSEKHIAMLQTFADQAVIAIENVRLFNETKESLERQTATAEILKVIASSPSDVRPVFDAIAASAKRLLDGGAAVVARRDGDMLHLAAYTRTGEAGDAVLRSLFPSQITGKGHLGRAILSGRPVLISDIETDPNYSDAFRASARTRGLRSIVTVPLLREGEAIGVISVNRPIAGNFSDHQTNLLRTFADQAVIAIENVRLFNETKEALERQTATSEVLRVISSSPTDLAPVYRTILENITRLCESQIGALFLYDGEVLRAAATHGTTSEFGEVLERARVRPSRDTTTRLAALERRTVHVADLLSDPAFTPKPRDLYERENVRTVLSVPMLRENALVGVITTWRREVRPFSERQISLVRTFADQAVIAIENVRLFNETKEALERQTATGEILKVISSTMTDTRPVFDAIVESAKRLCGADRGGVYRVIGDRLVAAHTPDAEAAELVRQNYPRPVDTTSLIGRSIVERRVIYVPDLEDPAAEQGLQ
ncbi:MAG: GAF domain-containing protein, partial [Burkholderiales bacterium]